MKEQNIREILSFLYGPSRAEALSLKVNSLIRKAPATKARKTIEAKDVFLITYPDQVREENIPPLQTLLGFCEKHLKTVVSAIHILPFYPSSSDDGFSVIDYRQVDPAFGSWDDLENLSRSFALMFDAVINHASAQSAWFRNFLNEDPRYADHFVAAENYEDLQGVVRPRTHPLLTPFSGKSKKVRVWTTFSADQVDLNFCNPEVLMEVLDLLQFYAAKGAEYLRLDAIGYLWKQRGTSCIHLPQTHAIVRLFRAFLDQAAPNVRLITETNVPHQENVAYFGDGSNEAHFIYNFALPPLTLHTLLSGNSCALTHWAASLQTPTNQVAFFNFLASHDGIGLNPAHQLLSRMELDTVVAHCIGQGGYISYKHVDGSEVPYEININYFDALGGDIPLELQLARFLAAHFILMVMPGVPAFYFHSLFGSRNWKQGVIQTGRERVINRQKLNRAEIEAELSDPQSLRSRVFNGLCGLQRMRAMFPEFDPYGRMQVLHLGDALFGLVRSCDTTGTIVCVQNVTDRPQKAMFPTGPLNLSAYESRVIRK